MQQHDSNLRPSVREHFTDNTPTSRFAAFFARLDWHMVYDLGTLATIALCGIAHAVNTFQALNNPSLFASVMPVFGFTGGHFRKRKIKHVKPIPVRLGYTLT